MVLGLWEYIFTYCIIKIDAIFVVCIIIYDVIFDEIKYKESSCFIKIFISISKMNGFIMYYMVLFE